MNAQFRIAKPANEPIYPYAPGDKRRDNLKGRLDEIASQTIEIPLIIGGKEIRTGNKQKVVMPHAHREVLAEFHTAGPEEMKQAILASQKAKSDWENLSWNDRASVFLKAADLLATTYRDTLNAATMLGQSKNAFQAEIDSACELIDFFRFNAYYYQEILNQQPESSAGVWNRLEQRSLEGFVLAITPFNFTAIAGNLPAAPAMLGNTVIWKPSDTQMLSAYYTFRLLQEAGLPDGVINFVPSDGPLAGQTYIPHPDLAGIHFTGSTSTFQTLYRGVAENLSNYKSYPRIVGETGGKDFVFVHPNSDWEAACIALVRGAYEYQGQKCSAASRAYLPRSLWPKMKDRLISEIKTLKMGDVRDFRNFVNAVIDERSFKKIQHYLEYARNSSNATLLAGGQANQEVGYFVAPTLIETTDPKFRTMVEEIFGPVLTVFVYDDEKLDETLEICNHSTNYALTGAIFAQDRGDVAAMTHKLRHAAGNFYINDKPTGAVVGQQPFGGGRASGTNDKAGSALNLHRWLSPRTLKETFVPPHDYRYPFMGAE